MSLKPTHIAARPRPNDRRGFVLITVVATLSVMLILVVGLLGSAETELKSSGNFKRIVEAKALADIAKNVVIAQIRRATGGLGDSDVMDPVGWSSQPGALHTWGSKGAYLEGYKLYSSPEMRVATAAGILEDRPEANWDEQPARYADLNRPSIATRTGTSTQVRFPVVDPRVGHDPSGGNVEGFSVDATAVNGIELLGSGVSRGRVRLPMPVEWLYVLRDGTLGTAVADGSVYVFQGSKTPTADNPIVGRIAFWTDDETCKLNVNTATAPTPWDTPRSGNKVDYDYGRYQPAMNEWQRYPGHPAMTSLAPAVFPDREMTVEMKEELYRILPRVREGGTIAGTVRPGQILIPDGDRLYATAEEFALLPDRTPQSLLTPDDMDEMGFFLTAHSSAPELNAFGFPRVAIWPVGGEGFRRSAFDNLVAFCATVNRQPYYFQRKDPNSGTKDWLEIRRNQEIYAYLQRLTAADIPGVGKNFAEKWGEDRDQILTQIFDYIRCTNLREKTDGATVYAPSGQVTPIRLPNETKGFGRFYSISEFTLHFICNGDGNQPDGIQNPDDPLEPGERLIECAFLIEPFCPSQGFFVINNNFSVRVSGLENFRIEGESLEFQPGSFRKPGNLNASWHGRNWGGPTGVRTWIGNSGSGYQFRGRRSVKVNVSGAAEADGGTMQFTGGRLTVEIFYGGAPDPANLVQSMEIDFPSATFPVPRLVESGTTIYRGARATPKEWWWSFGNTISVDDAVTGGLKNLGNPTGSGRYQGTTACPHAAGPEYADLLRRWPLNRGHQNGFKEGGVFRLEDVVRSVVPTFGDMRLIAGREKVPAKMFRPHHFYDDTKRRIDHLLNDSQGSNLLYGFSNEPTLDPYPDADDKLTTNAAYDPVGNPIDRYAQLTPVPYHYSRLPDVPIGTGIFNLWGDFDNGVAQIHDGAYINKPDEGNVATRDSYAYFAWNFVEPTVVNFSPNRMIPSPGMFGSLPTASKRNRAWETLLLRPQARHPGNLAPHDHHLLDLFWMPVIEPWAISEPFSTKGKINLNYRIAPFSYITRTTALRGLLSSEEMLHIPNEFSKAYKLWDHETSDHPWLPDSTAGNTDPDVRRKWAQLARGEPKIRRLIDADETLRQFEERFAAGHLFRSASEICEIHLVGEGQTLEAHQDGTHQNGHILTGDNTRERPYTNLYQRLTARSNTYRVHVLAQVITKARATDVGAFDPSRDTVTAEYQGSSLIERYLDQTDPAIPDYAVSPGETAPSTFYKFRVLGESRFFR